MVEAGQPLPRLTWRVVDQGDNTIEISGGHIVLNENPALYHLPVVTRLLYSIVLQFD